jgi:hypothetical protein
MTTKKNIYIRQMPHTKGKNTKKPSEFLIAPIEMMKVHIYVRLLFSHGPASINRKLVTQKRSWPSNILANEYRYLEQIIKLGNWQYKKLLFHQPRGSTAACAHYSFQFCFFLQVFVFVFFFINFHNY